MVLLLVVKLYRSRCFWHATLDGYDDSNMVTIENESDPAAEGNV